MPEHGGEFRHPKGERTMSKTQTETEKEARIREIIEGLPEGYELYAAVGALVAIAEVLDWPDA